MVEPALPRRGAINQVSISGTSVERALVVFARPHYWQMDDGESCANFVSPSKRDGSARNKKRARLRGADEVTDDGSGGVGGEARFA